MGSGQKVELFARVGDVIADKFRIERVIGEGGMGLVFEATHLLLDERVALKFLRREVMLDADIVARFAQEARACAKLRSEHVARVLDVGMDREVPYIVMEYLEGKNLEDVIQARGALPITEAVELLVQAAEGISEAHARGIIHRDLKPANLFLAQRGDGWPTLKILDFGISKAALTTPTGAAPLAAPNKKTMTLLGSPYYMSPEQLRSTGDVDRRTDIWALGTVLFELLTGHTAFASTDFVPLVHEISNQCHQRLTDLRPDAPQELEDLVDRALAKNPDDRFQSAGSLALALLPFTNSKRSRVIAAHAVTLARSSGIEPDLPLPSTVPTASGNVPHISIPSGAVPRFDPNSSRPPQSARPVTGGAVISTSDTVDPLLATASSARPAPRSRGVAVAVGLLVVALLAGGAVLAFSGRRAPEAGTAATARTEAPAVTTAASTAAIPATAEAPSAAPPPLPSQTAAHSAAAPNVPVPTAATATPRFTGRPVPPPPPPPTSKPLPTTPSDLEIRRER